jgi:hypothetical protein
MDGWRGRRRRPARHPTAGGGADLRHRAPPTGQRRAPRDRCRSGLDGGREAAPLRRRGAAVSTGRRRARARRHPRAGGRRRGGAVRAARRHRRPAELFGSTFHAELPGHRLLPAVVGDLATIVEATVVGRLSVPRGVDGLAAAERVLQSQLGGAP